MLLMLLPSFYEKYLALSRLELATPRFELSTPLQCKLRPFDLVQCQMPFLEQTDRRNYAINVITKFLWKIFSPVEVRTRYS